MYYDPKIVVKKDLVKINLTQQTEPQTALSQLYNNNMQPSCLLSTNLQTEKLLSPQKLLLVANLIIVSFSC